MGAQVVAAEHGKRKGLWLRHETATTPRGLSHPVAVCSVLVADTREREFV